MPAPNTPSQRLEFVDFLRGFFIVNIIVDHLWRFPSAFALLSGQGALWVSSAEGFVMISGFLIGYVRGYKGQKTAFRTLAAKLSLRALLLYAAMIVAGCVYVAIEWSGLVHGMPHTHLIDEAHRNWGEIIWGFVTLEQPHTWVYFLALYAVFLLLSVGAVWLLRRRLAWLLAALSIAIYCWGQLHDTMWMKWQLLFFGATLAGFYFEQLRAWRQAIAPRRAARLRVALFATAGTTIMLSAIATFWPELLPGSLASQLDNLFREATMSPARIGLSVLWFTALTFVFYDITPWLRRHTGGIIEYIGSHSLQAYLAHGLIICLINLALPDSANWLLNTLYGLTAVIGVWLFIRLPVVRTVLPR